MVSNLPGVVVLPESTIFEYSVAITTENPIYDGQRHFLRIIIGDDYPGYPPLVLFLKEEGYEIPLHPHIYSNGHICLSILGKDWTPACLIESILLSVQSVLNTNTEKSRPPDDARYVKHAPHDPKKTSFVYHDDTV